MYVPKRRTCICQGCRDNPCPAEAPLLRHVSCRAALVPRRDARLPRALRRPRPRTLSRGLAEDCRGRREFACGKGWGCWCGWRRMAGSSERAGREAEGADGWGIRRGRQRLAADRERVAPRSSADIRADPPSVLAAACCLRARGALLPRAAPCLACGTRLGRAAASLAQLGCLSPSAVKFWLA